MKDLDSQFDSGITYKKMFDLGKEYSQVLSNFNSTMEDIKRDLWCLEHKKPANPNFIFGGDTLRRQDPVLYMEDLKYALGSMKDQYGGYLTEKEIDYLEDSKKDIDFCIQRYEKIKNSSKKNPTKDK